MPQVPVIATGRRSRVLTVATLVIGFGASVVAFVAAGPRPGNPLGYDPLETKKYIHDLELYGGKANVAAAEFQEWFAGLWYGRNLAYTIAVITLCLAFLVRFFTIPLPEAVPDEADGETSGQTRAR